MRLRKAYHSGTPELRRTRACGIPLLLIAAAFVLAPAAVDARLGAAVPNLHAAQAAVAPQAEAQSPPARPAGAQTSGPRPAKAQKQPLLRAQAAELLQLARQLQSDVKKTNKDMLSLSVVRKADAIEKLARTMKAERPDHGQAGH
ncbi:MAG TPA: hypothetical protein VFU55_03485 [Terracidiphilus sp.]|nr:hypothetical protein [Terracidiphilus sp.]